jgi:exopolyphosphatase/guanosine-5'-triphosphate,3'-diphosphate pyrophosphatase
VRVAVIDLGSNSFRLLVADIEPGGALRPVLRERELLYLGGRLGDDGLLGAAEVSAAVAATKRLHDLAVRTGAQRIIAVATAAIRSAANRELILEALSDAAGTPVRLLDGAEEARLGFLGVAASVALPDEPHLVFDLGGGSLELTVGSGADVMWSTSLPIGTSRLHAGNVGEDPMSIESERAIRADITEIIGEAGSAIARLRPAAAAAIGGSVRAVARVIAARTLGWTPGILNQFYVTADEIRTTAELLVPMERDDRLQVSGVKESRADQIATAAVILDEILQRLRLERVWVSYWGLREGAIIDEYGSHEFPLGAALRATSVGRMAQRFVRDGAHCSHVGRLASSLFAQTRRLHGLAESDRELMLYAASLHTVGKSVAFNGYARHGAYLIEHSELRGFSPNEIAMLSSLVRFHRRGSARSDHEPYANLTKPGKTRADVLIAILHTADMLDQALDQSVADVELRHEPGVVNIRLLGDDPHVRRDWAAKATESMARALDVTLVFDRGQLLET